MGLAGKDFGRERFRGAEKVTAVRLNLGLVHMRCKAEIGQEQRTVGVDEAVARLDVTVNDPMPVWIDGVCV